MKSLTALTNAGFFCKLTTRFQTSNGSSPFTTLAGFIDVLGRLRLYKTFAQKRGDNTLKGLGKSGKLYFKAVIAAAFITTAAYTYSALASTKFEGDAL